MDDSRVARTMCTSDLATTPNALGVVRHSGRAGGFTFIELIIVIAIMGITASIAIPRYGNSLARYRIETAAHRVAADLALAQQTASAESRTVTITFNPANDRYAITSIADPDDAAAPGYVVDLADAPYRAKLDSSWFGGTSTAEFNGFGAPSQSGTVVLRAGTNYRTIVLEDTTGATRIVVTEKATADLIKAGDPIALIALGVTP